jgi:hypothetical protein
MRDKDLYLRQDKIKKGDLVADPAIDGVDGADDKPEKDDVRKYL